MASATSERELKDRAHQLLGKGRLDPALKVLRQLICINGREPAYRLRHADLCTRLGQRQAAVGSLRVAAHLLAEEGRLAQARAALHRAMALAPKDVGLRRMVAALVSAPELPTRPEPALLGRDDEAPTEPCLLPLLE